ncbi:Mor transcription activator family protein [Sulfuricystis thermophila]|uniref:Mor transcription activator family protein n=1 Tax=Sulfuricystis thermophila TaxID=2496847 RepID=UPI001035AC16|nr:Mor transcription activator family protein [Sulfuricystis thermophila]
MACSQLLTEYLGEAAAARLCAALGGCQIKIPKRRDGVWWARLVEAIGERDAEELCRIFGGESIYIPRNAASGREELRRLVLRRLAAGETFAEIARSLEFRVRYSERGLRKLVAGPGNGALLSNGARD